MFDGLKTAVVSGAKTAGLMLMDKAPVLMFAGGVVMFGVTVYCAVKAAPKVDEAIKKHNEAIKDLDEKLEKTENQDENDEEKIEYSKKDYNKDVRSTYGHTVLNVIKAAATPTCCALVSIGLFGGAVYLPVKAVGAMTTKYLATKRSFEEYRGVVREEEGAEKDAHYMFKTKQKIEPVEVEGDENHETIASTESVQNDYFWHWCEETSPIFTSAEVWNDNLLVSKMQNLTEMLRKTHVLTNNDILKELAMYGEIKKDPMTGIKFGKKWKEDGDNTFKFEIHKIWVPDYKKGPNRSRLIYELRYDEELL